jgi:hypothetical protein
VVGAAVSNESQSVEPGGQYFEGKIESARDRFLVDAFTYGIEQGGYRPKAKFFQNSPGGRQLGMGIGRSVESKIVIAHAIFNSLLLDLICSAALFYTINLTSKFVAFLAQLISQGPQ